MRISYWSSDVCSSDLFVAVIFLFLNLNHEVARVHLLDTPLGSDDERRPRILDEHGAGGLKSCSQELSFVHWCVHISAGLMEINFSSAFFRRGGAWVEGRFREQQIGRAHV